MTPEAMRAIGCLRFPGHIRQLMRLTDALARTARRDTRLTGGHVERAAAEVGDVDA